MASAPSQPYSPKAVLRSPVVAPPSPEADSTPPSHRPESCTVARKSGWAVHVRMYDVPILAAAHRRVPGTSSIMRLVHERRHRQVHRPSPSHNLLPLHHLPRERSEQVSETSFRWSHERRPPPADRPPSSGKRGLSWRRSQGSADLRPAASRLSNMCEPIVVQDPFAQGCGGCTALILSEAIVTVLLHSR